ncbi:MAG: energy transducer TonB [Candidatus Margulisbacteria bacterium]|jgi:protein TonB|nr:energy transducer TonB [Candidatus Margulisiibacteriota bacterium]
MVKYLGVSLLLHLLVFLPFCLTGQLDLNNFYCGQNAGGAVLPVGLCTDTADAAAEPAYAVMGSAELAAYAAPDNLPPRYPPLALLRRWQGESVLLLNINRDGVVEEVSLTASSGHRTLDEAALSAARRWRFRGLPEAVQVRFPVRFVLD